MVEGYQGSETAVNWAVLEKLNPSQKSAVMTESGPLLVLAGAGSGKTRVVTVRIAYLIKNGILPDRILAVTFTNKAAAEMQQRVAELLGRRRKRQPQISTFHSLCVKVLKRHITRLGYPQRFSIYAAGQQESLASSVLREVSLDGAKLKPSELLYHVSTWKSQAVDPHQAARQAQTDKEHLAAAAYRRYQAQLRAMGAVDFDDLLLCTEELFRRFPDVRREEAQLFDHIMIDEYQDTNRSQYRIIKALAARHRNLCVVGDDDQSIYAWRGAEVEHILSFARDWPDARVVRLQENYRSTAEILTLANRLIRFNKVRHDKRLIAARDGGERPRILQHPDEATEAEEVIADIRRRLEVDNFEPRDFAILFRTKEQPRIFETELRQHNLPYVLIGGMSFFDRREVRDVLAYLQLLDNPHDEMALRRIINVPPRGIGPGTVERVARRASSRGIPIWDVLNDPNELSDLEPRHAKSIAVFTDRVSQYREDLNADSFVNVANKMLGGFRYETELKRRHPDADDYQARWRAVEEVINALGDYEQRARKPDLNEFLLDSTVNERDKDDKDDRLKQNAIVLMTLHAAKGLEFPHVYMVGLEENILPHHRSITTGESAIEEERRLCYVGVTRAEEYLTLSLALARRKWGKLRPTNPSRFLFEITGAADHPQESARLAAENRNKARRKAVGGRRNHQTARARGGRHDASRTKAKRD